mmetsp:Transcript_38362/g.92515  ORF Transcript_38362/g.92515 Transcript_38362/m.92515 type:complete len:88 (+) Transcript_38362:773-1036(+)
MDPMWGIGLPAGIVMGTVPVGDPMFMSPIDDVGFITEEGVGPMFMFMFDMPVDVVFVFIIVDGVGGDPMFIVPVDVSFIFIIQIQSC